MTDQSPVVRDLDVSAADALPEPVTRRGLSRTVAAGLAAAATAPLISGGPAEAAWGPKHAKNCHHWHRCKKHRRHTCRHKHRCKHLNHKAPKPTKPPPKPPIPTGPQVDPVFVGSALPTACVRCTSATGSRTV